MHASHDEYIEHFRATTVPTYDFRVYDEFDNGEFITTAKVDLIERGQVVHTESFFCSSEDAYGFDFSAYGNGRDNHAGTQARSYAWAWIELREAGGIEGVLAPFGPEWEREQEVAA
jgi:hypothetical protein